MASAADDAPDSSTPSGSNDPHELPTRPLDSASEPPDSKFLYAGLSDRLLGPVAAGRWPGLSGGHEAPGTVIGPYQLLEFIGAGTFGEVWLAERREPFVQRVAIKIIKRGMDSTHVVARFEQERQALALMDHPNVAKVLDGGVTSPELGSRPYFVMEYVAGVPFTTYCDRERLNIRQRLALFITVCDAVQHAHQKGVIHRDLKPSNVLVAPGDGANPQPIAKVIDFGLAKALSGKISRGTIHTEFGVPIGTFEYMSPELTGLDPGKADTRSDVYSLGVMLYELLTGVRPFTADTFVKAAIAEITRVICEVDPPRPSRRLLDSATATPNLEARLGADIPTLARELRRELEWIPLKALRKNRNDRYDSAADLGKDIRRYLDGLPLEAGPESGWYRARKYLRRHRGLVATASLVLAAIVIGGGVAAWQWRIAAEERDATRRLLGFVSTAVVGAADDLDSGATIPIPETRLDAARAEFERGFATSPRLLESMRLVFARAYLSGGFPARTLELLPDTQVSPSLSLPEIDPAILRSEAFYRLRRGREAVDALEAPVRALEQALGPQAATDLTLADRKRRLAAAFKWAGRLGESRREFVSALHILESNGTANPVDLIRTRFDLALVRHEQIKRAEKAGSLHRLSVEGAFHQRWIIEQQLDRLAVKARALQSDSVDAIKCDVERIRIRYAQGYTEEAVDELRELLPSLDDAFGSRSARTLEARATLGQWEYRRGRFHNAVELLERAYRGYAVALGFTSTDTAKAGVSLAFAVARTGDVERALIILREALGRSAEVLPDVAELADLADRAAAAAKQWKRPDEEAYWSAIASKWRSASAPHPGAR